MTKSDTQRYLAIADYAYLSDCHSAALVSRSGSIDWCCMPRVDAASCFGRILDAEKGGFFKISPADPSSTSSRRYLGDSLVVETTFSSGGGEVRLLDCFVMREGGKDRPHRQLLRIIEGVRGRMELAVAVSPRLDYGAIRPWLHDHGQNVWSVVGGDAAFVLTADTEMVRDGDHDLVAKFEVAAGARKRFSMTYIEPAELDDQSPELLTPEDLDTRLDETTAWWAQWSSILHLEGPDGAAALRSAIVLKGLTNAPTGAVAAAPTTSLPESPGGSRNWDYRLSWVRDSTFVTRSLAELGAVAEAQGFRRFIQRSAAGSAEALQIVYGIGGTRRLTELTLDHLEGWGGAQPVRIGNAAAVQIQNDVYGELLDLSWQWHRRGHSPDDDYWRFLLQLVDRAGEMWAEPDQGLWEMRGEPRHFVHSKVMCWSALDRGIRLAQECLRQAPVRRWKITRDEIRASVEAEGFDAQRASFVQSYGSSDLDAALLLLPTVDFLAWDDPRMISTTDAIADALDDGTGMIFRYNTFDELEGREGVFVACTFWLAECFARQGRLEQARAALDRATSTGNDLGLYSEEFDTTSSQLLGNFPQALSHLSHISAAVALSAANQTGVS
jgi:GH15 family glucan-1,4-alpha-glucosidase